MGIITTQDIKVIVEKYGKTSMGDGDWYLIVNKEFADGIRKWLDSYVYTIEGEWLDYSLKESKNETEVYVLHLYSRWPSQTEGDIYVYIFSNS